MVCLDGISWEYIRASNMPSLKDIERNGTSTTCRSMMPTVTNVNNASILTGRSPLEHGITGNYFFEESDQSETYMDSPRFLRCPTLLEDASSKGFKTLLITVKDKLRRLLSKGATTSFSLEVPSSRIVRKIGKPPSIYSSEANLWLLDAAITLLETGSFQIVYVSTTDYVPHKFAPKSMEAIQQMEAVDEKLGEIAERAFIGVVADHGMNRKSVKVDLVKSLTEFNITSRAIPIIKDEHVEHHQNLGGSVYLYIP
jgi:phosphonoacetate hydrolase